MYLNCKQAVDKELAQTLPDCKGVSFAANYWTSRSQDPYLGMTMHWVDKEFRMRKMLVACRRAEGQHTGINIASHIDKVVGAVPGLKGSTTRLCVTDNAANMWSAVPRQTKKIDKGLGCFDHILNLVMKATNSGNPTFLLPIFVTFVTIVVLYRYFCCVSKNSDAYFCNFCFRNVMTLQAKFITVPLTSKGSGESARTSSMTLILWSASTGKLSLM